VASSLRELTRDRAGVRVGRRSDRSVEAMLAVNGAVFARGVVSAVGRGRASQSLVSLRGCSAAGAWLCAGAESEGEGE
jgi:hypothetical protein